MRETARNLLSAGVSAVVIAEVTGMTVEEMRAVSDEGR
jgi:hypothetical protein